MMKKILIVDDDLVVLATLSLGLQRAGYQVFEADSGEAALKLERAETPALVLLDMRMPGMDGLAVARILRERRRAPFIFLSAFSDEDIVREAADAGALGYLVKPIEFARIVPAIEVALVRSDERSRLEEHGANLADALNRNREIDVAIGMLMVRFNLDRASAFNLLREQARSRRCRIVDVAQQLIDEVPQSGSAAD